jgi:TRAP-type C4-dicarboxylate transport system permease small subunit
MVNLEAGHGRLHEIDEEADMRMIGIVILAAGILALAYGGFSYTRQTHDVKVGALEISLSEKNRVNVPIWAGVVLAVVGGGLLISGKK